MKYRDEAGTVRFKTKKAKKTDKKNSKGRAVYACENKDNDLKAYLPERVDSGVLMEKEDNRLELFPEAEKNSKARLTEEAETAAAVYADVLPDKADLALSYTPDGIRLQIQLEQYTGQNEIRFTVDPHGLVPQKLEGHMIVFGDPKTGEAVCTLNPLELCSADYAQTGSYADVSYNNAYRLAPEEDGRYTLTTVLDEDFLADAATPYPLAASTTVVWRYVTKDTTVFEGDSGNYHTSAYDYVGYYPAGRSKLRAMKLAQMDTSVLKYINPDNITAAYYYTQVSGAADSWTLRGCKPSLVWNPETVNYAEVENRYSLFYATNLTNTALTTLKIPLTSLLKTWLKVELGESTALDSRQGILLEAGGDCPETSYRTFYSADGSSRRPAFVVEYTPDTSLSNGYYFIRNAGSGRYLDVINSGSTEGTGTCIYNFNGQNNQLWYVSLIDSSQGYYKLTPRFANWMYLSADNVYSSPLSLSSTMDYFGIVLNSDGTYRIMVDASERQAAESAGGNMDNGALVKTWGYGGAPNQKWFFEKATQLGGAGAYRQVNTTDVNCFAYALGLNEWVSPGYANKSGQNYNMDYYYDGLVSRIHGHGLQCRRLSGKDAYIRPNEYKIVARSGEQRLPGQTVADSHFMVQINTEGWAEKMGRLPSENLGFINPGTYSWNLVLPDPVTGKPVDNYTGFYDSPLMYIAIWR